MGSRNTVPAARPSLRPLVLVASLLLGALAGAVATTKHDSPRPPATHPPHAQVHVILAHDVIRVPGTEVTEVGALE
ncbi:MAG TPA: hypothetical protein VGP46_11105 [Acidimicrobiales bacterium]|nr:hypothetical protein [Acidimicrobiales bacterium]